MHARGNRQLAFPAEKVLRGRLQAVQGTAAPVVLLALDDPSAVVALQLPTRSVAGPIHVCASVDVCSVAAVGARRGSGLTLHTVAVGGWVIYVQLVVRAPVVVDATASIALAAATDNVCLSRQVFRLA